MRQQIRKTLPALLMLLLLLPLILSSSDSPQAPHLLIYQADQFYQANRFADAAQLYEQVINRYPQFAYRYPSLVLKIGYAFLNAGQPEQAINYLEMLKNRDFPLNDYRLYFLAKSRVEQGDSSQALEELNQLRRQYPQSPLIYLVDSLRAVLFEAASVWDSAYVVYYRIRNNVNFDRSQIYYRLFKLSEIRKRPQDVLKLGIRYLKKFPNHPNSRLIYTKLRKQNLATFSQKQISVLLNYLFTTGQYSEAKRMLKDLQKQQGESEFIRWKFIELNYRKGNFSKVISASKTARKFFKSKKYLREIDLHLARALLRSGRVKEAISAYLKFQQKYPRDPLSPEVLWKVAWLYEESGEIQQARKFYSRLITRYPRAKFVSEARFRLGLSYYREGDYANARNLFSRFRSKEKDNFQKDRLAYWIAKSYYQIRAYRKYFSLLKELGETPFEGYYNFKSFLLTRGDRSVHHSLDSLVWELHHQQQSYLPKYQNLFRRTLIVKEVFGNKYARYELSALYRKGLQSGWQFLYALGELTEKIQDYGKAFRIFRSIYLNQFQETDFREWQFLLRQLYPMYFMEEVLQSGEDWQLSPALILAIMKKESAFESRIISYANAYGLMQLIPPTAREVSTKLDIEFDPPRSLFEPGINIQLGSYYIYKLLRRYQGNLYFALAAYNAGPHRVDKWRKIFKTADDELFMENIEFEQTRNYVRTVMYYYWVYQLFIEPQNIPDQVSPYPGRLTVSSDKPDSLTETSGWHGVSE